MEYILHDISAYSTVNKPSLSLQVYWHPLKAYIRGLFIPHISKIKKNKSKAWERSVAKDVLKAESQYIINPTIEA